MAKCENCYHKDVCIGRPDVEEYGCKCEDYKDKSLMIELPCKVGDTVYAFCEMLGVILEYKVVGIGITEIAMQYEAYAYTKEEDILIDNIDYETDDIGKTIFLTREEAEKALKEYENET